MKRNTVLAVLLVVLFSFSEKATAQIEAYYTNEMLEHFKKTKTIFFYQDFEEEWVNEIKEQVEEVWTIAKYSK